MVWAYLSAAGHSGTRRTASRKTGCMQKMEMVMFKCKAVERVSKSPLNIVGIHVAKKLRRETEKAKCAHTERRVPVTTTATPPPPHSCFALPAMTNQVFCPFSSAR